MNTNPNPPHSTAHEVCRWIQHRHEYVRELLTIAGEQTQLLEQRNYDGLVRVLARKQPLLDALQQQSNHSTELRTQWSLIRDSLPTELRNKCEHQLSETAEHLARLISHEQLSSQTLEQQRDQTRSQLQLVTGGLQAQQAYQEAPTGTQINYES